MLQKKYDDNIFPYIDMFLIDKLVSFVTNIGLAAVLLMTYLYMNKI